MVYQNKKKMESLQQNMIRRLWAYWDGPRPWIVEKSIFTWKKHLPDWDINVLDANSVKQYPIDKPSSFESLSVPAKTDVIRLSLLYQYGGVWVDASTLLLENLDWLSQHSQHPYYGFLLHNRYVESWFLFCPRPKEPLLKKWILTLNAILDTEPHTAHVAYSSPCTSDGSYFMVYQAFCHLVATDREFASAFRSIPFERAASYFYSPLIPLSWHKRLVKFTRVHRTLLKYAPFPTPYIFLIVLVAIIVVFLCRKQR